MPYVGSLLFMSDPSQQLRNYDVYHSQSSVALGPFSQAYDYLGKVNVVYAGVIPELPDRVFASMRERGILDMRAQGIWELCGDASPVHEMYAMSSVGGGLDLYVHTMGQSPAALYSHYHLEIDEPSNWWMAERYAYLGLVTMPEWGPAVPAGAT